MRPETTWVPYGSTWVALPAPDEEEEEEDDYEPTQDDLACVAELEAATAIAGRGGGSWGLTGGPLRVIRGGAWRSRARVVRAAYRYANGPAARNVVLGFRLCFKGGPP